MRRSTVGALLGLWICGPVLADGPAGWVPAHCLARSGDTAEGAEPQRRWNAAYKDGFRAIEQGRLDQAETAMCRALIAARAFDPRDWRFAETLDELGRIAFELGDFELAERMQGAAIAEMLLAVGPGGEPLRPEDTSKPSPIREDCRSGVHVYTTRLGWILERTRGRTTTAELRRAPWQIFAAGYVPLDESLARRLDWLISRYLLEENLNAAEALTGLQQETAAGRGRY